MSTFIIVCLFICFFSALSISAFFSASETALLSLSPLQIQKISEKNKKAGLRISKLLSQPDVMLSTILIGNTFSNTIVASIGYTLVSNFSVFSPHTSELLSVFIVTALLLLLGEVCPKEIAIQHSERLAVPLSACVSGVIPLLYPLTFLLIKAISPFQKKFSPESRAVSDEELLSVVNLGEERGALDSEEGAMVRGILRLSELNASDVMTPRIDLIGIDLNDPPEEHLKAARNSPFEWLPVWRDTPDNMVDFLDVQAFLLDPAHDISAALCKASEAVPENIGLDDLIILLYRQKLQLVFVADEYGGTAGIVSRGDILELLSLDTSSDVGEIPDIVPFGKNCWKIDGTASLEQINFELGTHLEADDADRISGWVTFHAGCIPKVGDKIEADGYCVTIQKLRRRAILQVLLQDLNPESQNTELSLGEDGSSHNGQEEETEE